MLAEKKIVVAGGGTAGHIFPILAVAEILKRQGAEILYLGTPGGIERKIVGKSLTYQAIFSGKLRRYLSFYTLWDFLKLGLGIKMAFYRLLVFKPNLVFAKGGYVSLPVLIAARALKIKIVNHESDAVLGLANRLAHRWAVRTCFGFDLIHYQGIDVKKSVFTGTPVQPGFSKLVRRKNFKLFNFRKDQPTILVLGGSQGSSFINQAIRGKLKDYLEKAQIIHMVGDRDYDKFQKIKEKLPSILRKRYFMIRFLGNKELPASFAVADLVISRSGASTLADIALAQKPAILIPLPWAAGNHQKKNAEIYAKQDAVVKFDQDQLSGKKLFETVIRLLADPAELKLMSRRIARMREPRAAQKIVGVIAKELT